MLTVEQVREKAPLRGNYFRTCFQRYLYVLEDEKVRTSDPCLKVLYFRKYFVELGSREHGAKELSPQQVDLISSDETLNRFVQFVNSFGDISGEKIFRDGEEIDIYFRLVNGHPDFLEPRELKL